MEGERGVVELDRLPFDRRPARLTCTGGVVEVLVPTWLGAEAWRLPADEVGVADLTTAGWGTGGDVFRDRLALPYLTTKTPFTKPTTVLLFRTPQRVPDGARTSLQTRAGFVDGLTVRVDEPARAVDRLASGGAIAVGDPARFLRQHREVVVDPAERAAMLREDRAGLYLKRVSAALCYVALFAITWLVVNDQETTTWRIVPVVALGVAGVLWWLAIATRRSTG